MTHHLPAAPSWMVVVLLVLAHPAGRAEDGCSLLCDLFPTSKAPEFLSVPSEFVVSKQFAPVRHFPSRWTEGVDERQAFHAYLMHQSTDERSWELRC